MTILKAKEGYRIVRKDHSAVYDSVIYLADIDSKDNYEEMKDEDAESLKESIEKEIYQR